VIALAAALLLQAAAAPEPAWQSLGVHQQIETAYDPASVRRENGRVRVRIRGITPTVGADGIKTGTGTIEIDCAAGTAIAIDLKAYDAAGRLMLNAIVPVAERQPEPIQPEGPTAAVRDLVCQRQGQ
jgi:hypothetical protein